MSIQSVIIPKDIYNIQEAIYIIKQILNLNFLKIHETSKKYRFRIKEPNPNKRYWTEYDDVLGIRYVIFI